MLPRGGHPPPTPSGFPPGPIGGIMGHGRPTQNHLRRHARVRRARRTDLLLGRSLFALRPNAPFPNEQIAATQKEQYCLTKLGALIVPRSSLWRLGGPMAPVLRRRPGPFLPNQQGGGPSDPRSECAHPPPGKMHENSTFLTAVPLSTSRKTGPEREPVDNLENPALHSI
jgi:hypothetical protein